MKSIAVVLVALALVLVGPSSLGARPKPGQVYKGPSIEADAKGVVTIKAASKNRLKVIKNVDSCGNVWKVKNVAVAKNGRFSATITYSHVNAPWWVIRGVFVKKGAKAKGTIENWTCGDKYQKFRALKK